jgi:CHASE2 domain-containing sensor protein
MVNQWWSWILGAVGVTGLVLVYRYPKRLIGPGIGIAIQALWITYAIVTRQWGFVPLALCYAGANVYGIRTRRPRRTPVS